MAMFKFVRSNRGISFVEYGILCACIAVVAALAIGLSYWCTGNEKGNFNSDEYKDVSLRDLFENPGKFGEGYKLAVMGYPRLISKNHWGPVKYPGIDGYLYNLQERKEVSWYGNPEILMVTYKKDPPFRAKIWGILRKKNI